jgi:hypothetical protein
MLGLAVRKSGVGCDARLLLSHTYPSHLLVRTSRSPNITHLKPSISSSSTHLKLIPFALRRCARAAQITDCCGRQRRWKKGSASELRKHKKYDFSKVLFFCYFFVIFCYFDQNNNKITKNNRKITEK